MHLDFRTAPHQYISKDSEFLRLSGKRYIGPEQLAVAFYLEDVAEKVRVIPVDV
tara:strand:+ start:915 stop:1076 length:162 start_codon:yes stop_codon:yes gene_type:complete